MSLLLGLISTALVAALAAWLIDPARFQLLQSDKLHVKPLLMPYEINRYGNFGASRVTFGTRLTGRRVTIFLNDGLTIGLRQTEEDFDELIWTAATRSLASANEQGLFPPAWASTAPCPVTPLPLSGAGPARFHFYTAAVDARGWPAYAFGCAWTEDISLGDGQMGPVKGGIQLPGSPPGDLAPWAVRAIPLTPIWSGIAIDTLVYAGVWGALIGIPIEIRRQLRQSRGHCIHCGYDRSGLPIAAPCPECGVSLLPMPQTVNQSP